MSKASNHEWVKQGVCRTSGVNMYPSEGDERGTKDARAQCASCPVTRQCLTEALRNGERFGMWGGMTPGERTRVRQRITRANRDAASKAAAQEGAA